MFSGIGETHLANELGLPPDSLRVKNRTKSVQDTMQAEPRRFPAELSKASTTDRQAPVPSRTTSLPATPSLTPTPTNRTPSSPHPVVRPKTPVSRSSSIKSAKRPFQLGPPLADEAPLLPPILPPPAVNEDTIKPRQRETSGSTIAGSSYNSPSVRLVGTPRPASLQTSPAGSQVLAEWRRSPHSADQTEDTMEVVMTPGPDEDEEEKGRRIACELLEDNYKSVPYDKVAMFLGGP